MPRRRGMSQTQKWVKRYRAVLHCEGLLLGFRDVFCTCEHSSELHVRGPRTHKRGHTISGSILDPGRCLAIGCRCAQLVPVTSPVLSSYDVGIEPDRRTYVQRLGETNARDLPPARDKEGHVIGNRLDPDPLDSIRIQLPELVSDHDPVSEAQWLAFLSKIEGRDPKSGGGSGGRQHREKRGPSVEQIREQRRRAQMEDNAERPTRVTSVRALTEDLDDLRGAGITNREAIHIAAESVRRRKNDVQTRKESSSAST